MKTTTFKVDWLIPMLGVALVGGGYFPMKKYLGLQRQIHDGEQMIATTERLWQDCNLGEIMAQSHVGGCASTAHGLDQLLTESLSAELAKLDPADADRRALVEVVSRFIDRRRPMNMALLPDPRAVPVSALASR